MKEKEKKMKKLLSLVLVFVLAFSVPAQAAVKKITAESCKGEAPADYPEISTGKSRVTLKCKTWNTAGCLIFTAPKTGTYKFTFKNSTAGSALVGTSTGSPLNDSPENLHLGSTKYHKGPDSGKLYLKKGDSVYVSLSLADLETGNYENGKLTLVIKKIK